MQEKNYYEVLRIEKSIESEEIHTAYKHMCKEYQNKGFALYEYICKMQELNKAYLTLTDEETRKEYDEESETETDTDTLQLPFEIDEESAKKNRVRLNSCSLLLDSENDIKAIGEVSSTDASTIHELLEIRFSIYDSNGRLLGTENVFGNKSGHQMIFNEYLFNKMKPAIPAKVKIRFLE